MLFVCVYCMCILYLYYQGRRFGLSICMDTKTPLVRDQNYFISDFVKNIKNLLI